MAGTSRDYALYEDILSDANDYGLMIIFHGCTLPRGWKGCIQTSLAVRQYLLQRCLSSHKMYAKKKHFTQPCTLLFANSVAGMEFGGVFMNKYLNRGNSKGQERLTGDVFQIATGILFQNPVQMFALTPNNLTDAPKDLINFMRDIPTTWDETLYIDGYPGKYAVIARRQGEQWYIAGVNALKEPLKLELNLPMLTDKNITLYNDTKNNKPTLRNDKINRTGKFTVTLQPNGGFVIKEQ